MVGSQLDLTTPTMSDKVVVATRREYTVFKIPNCVTLTEGGGKFGEDGSWSVIYDRLHYFWNGQEHEVRPSFESDLSCEPDVEIDDAENWPLTDESDD